MVRIRKDPLIGLSVSRPTHSYLRIVTSYDFRSYPTANMVRGPGTYYFCVHLLGVLHHSIWEFNLCVAFRKVQAEARRRKEFQVGGFSLRK